MMIVVKAYEAGYQGTKFIIDPKNFKPNEKKLLCDKKQKVFGPYLKFITGKLTKIVEANMFSLRLPWN